MDPLHIIVIGVCAFYVCIQGCLWYVDVKYPHLVNPDFSTPQQPAATDAAQPATVAEAPTKPHRFAFIMRMRPSKKVADAAEQKEAA